MPMTGTRSAIARAAASTTVTSTDGDKLTNGTPAQAPKPVTLDDVSTQNPDAMLALAHDFAAADFSAVQTEVVPNLLGATSFDKWLGPVHVYGSYQITPPDLDVTIAVKLPFVGPVTIGGIHGTEGCVGKSGIVQACLSMKLGELTTNTRAISGSV